ncbi:MAG: archaellin/type IV pilin N-terminal domain-containing protein [Angelakisella sp.]
MKITSIKALERAMSAKAAAAQSTINQKLRENKGDSNIVSIILMIVVVVVIGATVLFPSLKNMISEFLGKASTKIDSVMNFS